MSLEQNKSLDLEAYFDKIYTRHEIFRACGFVLKEICPGRAVIQLPEARPEHLGGAGKKLTLNGGYIAAMFDLALSGAVGSAILDRIKNDLNRASKMRYATISLNISYLAMASGDCFEVEGVVVRQGSGVAFAEGKLYDKNRNVCATAAGNYLVS